MKKTLFAVLGIIALSVQVNAQPKKSGAIQFESTFDPAAMASANGMQLTDEMIARMPKSSVTNFELLFNLTNASYMKVEDIEDSNGSSTGGGMRFGGFSGANKEYYYGFADHKLTEAFEVNDTTFLMDSKLGVNVSGGFGDRATPPVVEYIKSDDTRKILGYDCKKVIVKTTSKRRIQDEEKEVTEQTILWYTDELGFDFSPNPAMWAEGAVLSMEGKGSNVLAKSIEFRNVSSRDVNPPRKGTVITTAEYKAKMEQRMKQMRANRNKTQMRSMSIN